MMKRRKRMVMIMGGIVEIVLFIVLIAWQKYNVYFFLSVLGFVNSIALFCLCCEKINEENKKETRAQRKEEKKNRKLLKKERKEAFRKNSELLRKGANGDW